VRHIKRLPISFQAHVNVVYARAQFVNIIVYGALLWIQTVRFIFPVPPAQRAIGWASRGDLPACVAVLLVGDERPKKLVERLRARLGRSKMDEETVGQLLV